MPPHFQPNQNCLVHRKFLILVALCAMFFITLLLCTNNNDETAERTVYRQWARCMREYMERLDKNEIPDGFETEFIKTVTKCESIPPIQRIAIREFQNLDEMKYALMPIKTNTEMNIVTLGVGQDVNAEKRIKSALQDIPTHFFGADPMVEGNSQLYSAVGTFYPFAVSNTSASHKSLVLFNGSYVEQTVEHVELIKFMKEMVKKPFIDLMLIDAELAEYGLMDYFYRGGPLDANNITVCQFNMEVHGPLSTYKKKIKEFLLTLFKDQRYGFFRAINAYHLRLYFINLTDPKCFLKFLGN